MAPSTAQRFCSHCHQPFLPDWRNRNRQAYCQEPACQKARKEANQRARLKRNPGYFSRKRSTNRVRAFRQHRREAARQPGPAPSLTTTAPGGNGGPAAMKQDPFGMKQDSIICNPFVLGLLSRVFGCESKDDIETLHRDLLRRGQLPGDPLGVPGVLSGGGVVKVVYSAGTRPVPAFPSLPWCRAHP